MRKNLLLFFLGIAGLLLSVQTAEATHIPGANITYTCNPANPLEYTFTLTVFRKCPGTHPATMSALDFSLTNDCGLANPAVPTFNQIGVAQDVNQLCSSATSNCSGGTNPGVWMYTYEANITLPANCDGWHLAYELCCRDQSTNLSGTTTNDMYTSTTLNTSTAPCNNSPVVTAQPIPYACTNSPFTYCLTTSDVEGDSVSYAMVDPMTGAGAPIAHLAGFSTASPLTGFVLDPLTGCMTLNEPNPGNYVVTVQITEYDASDNITAQIVHDFQIMVVACTNSPPSNPGTGITNVSGTGTQTGPNNISLCYGDAVCFDVVFEDAINPGDNLTITTDGTTLLPGATFVQTGSNPAVGTFCWVAQPGFTSDIVTFIVEDDGCPVMGTSGFAVDFDIATGVYAGPDVTICGTQSAQLQAFGGAGYNWTPATGLSCTNCASPIATPTATTTYTVTGTVFGSCNNVDQVTVTVVPDFPLSLIPASATICANEAIQLSADGPAARGPFIYNWDPATALTDPAISNPVANPISSINYNISVTSADGCTMSGMVPVTVSGVGPSVTISPADTSICAGQAVQLTSTSEIVPIACGASAGCTGATGSGTIGTGTSSSSTYSPFYGSSVTNNYTAKQQYLFTAAELNSLGFFGGTIESVTLELVSSLGGKFDTDIWLGCVGIDEFPNGNFIPTASLTQVHSVSKYSATVGFHTFNFNMSDYDWDGVSSLIVQFCTAEFQKNGSSTIRYGSISPAYRTIYDYSSTVVSCNEASATRSVQRPNIGFGFCQQAVTSPTYSWTPIAGLSNPAAQNPVATPTTSTLYLLNVLDGASGCSGSAIANINVSPDYTLATTAVSPSICYGSSTDISSIPNPAGAGPFTYIWEPAATLSDPSVQAPTASPLGTTNYTVTVSNGYCTKTDNVNVSVAGGPVFVSANPAIICPGDNSVLDVAALPQSCGLNAAGCSGTTNTAIVGTGISSSTTYGPFYGGYQDVKYQFLYTATDLTAMGFTAGTITEIGFNVLTKNTTGSFNGFTISMGCTNDATLSTGTGWIPTAGVVYGPMTYTSTAGWNNFTLDTPFDWDGSSNIVIETCFDNSVTVGSDSYQYGTTTGATTMRNYSNTAGPGCTIPPVYTYSGRPNLQMTVCYASMPLGASFAWDNGATLSDPAIQSPTASPAVTTTYSVSVTDPGSPGCPSVGSITVDVEDVRIDVTPATPAALCAGDPPIALTSQLMVNGVATTPGGAGSGCYNQTISFANPALLSTNNYNFTGTPTNSVGGTLTVVAYGDVDLAGEIWTIQDELGGTIGTIGGSGGQCATTYTMTFPLSAAQINGWAANGSIDFVGVDLGGQINTTLCAVGADLLEMTLAYDCISGSGYTWSPAAGLSDPAAQNPTANPAGNATYTVEAVGGTGCTVTNTVDIIISTPSTAPTVSPIVGTYCPNTSMTLTAAGGTAGAGSSIEWYDGPNGTGTWLGSGGSYTFMPVDGQTIYARREGGCNTTVDDNVLIDLKDYVYALNSSSTPNYCTDDAGWHHFYVGDEIILSVQGDLSGAPAGFPIATIWDNGSYYQQAQGPTFAPACAGGGLPGEEWFEMERSWDFDFGGGTLNPPYNVRFYYQPGEKTAIETAANNWMAAYPSCMYAYKYTPNPNGFYWFKNTGSNYLAPTYDGTHYTGPTGMAGGSTNYVELTGVTSFSGGSGGISLIPTNPLLPVDWLEFNGATNEGVNHLYWATATEAGSSHFEIMRSADGVNFESIGTVAAQGNSTTVSNYTFDDESPLTGVNYYRLRLIDQSGNGELSNIVVLTIESKDVNYVFYPNPTEDIVYYQYEATDGDNLEIEIRDVLGRKLSVEQTTAVIGPNNIAIDLAYYPAGSYLIQVRNEQNATVHTAKITKRGF